ncbi:MAG: hypothetical protein ACXIUB_02190 [Wenzhouxiangella sp.]
MKIWLVTTLVVASCVYFSPAKAQNPLEPEEVFTHAFLGGNPGVIQSAGNYVLIPSPGDELGFWSTAGDADTAVRIPVIAPAGEPYQSLRFDGQVTQRTADRFFFLAVRSSSSLPPDIWVTDGTLAGTNRIVNTQALGLANNSSAVRYFATFGTTVAFAARLINPDEDRVFVIDESAPNNVIEVPNLQPFNGGAFERMRELNGFLYVSSTADGDRSLWRVDPTDFTATRVWSMGGSSSQRVAPANLMTAGGVLYFRARDDSNQYALWRLGSSGSGATRLHDPANSPPLDGDFRGSLRLIGGDDRLFFFASQYDTSIPGSPFWRNDARLATSLGTSTSTQTYWTDGLGSGWTLSTVANDELGTAGKQLIFKSPASASTGRSWWRSDGTASGTVPVLVNDLTIPAPGLPSGSSFGRLAQDVNGVWVAGQQGSVNRRIFFIGETDSDSFAVPGDYNRVQNFHAHAGRLWFTVQADVGGNRSVWRVCPGCLGDRVFQDRFESAP